MIIVTHGDGRPLCTLRSQAGDWVLTVLDPDVDIVVPSADELAAAAAMHDEERGYVPHEVAKVLGPVLDRCADILIETVTGGDLFDCAAGGVCEARGHTIPGLEPNPSETDKVAYDIAFFDVMDAALDRMRDTWGGYYDTFKVIHEEAE